MPDSRKTGLEKEVRKHRVTEPSRRYSVSKEAFSEGAAMWHPALKVGDWGVRAVWNFAEAPSGIPLGCWSRSRKCQLLGKVSLDQRQNVFQRCWEFWAEGSGKGHSKGPALVMGAESDTCCTPSCLTTVACRYHSWGQALSFLNGKHHWILRNTLRKSGQGDQSYRIQVRKQSENDCDFNVCWKWTSKSACNEWCWNNLGSKSN